MCGVRAGSGGRISAPCLALPAGSVNAHALTAGAAYMISRWLCSLVVRLRNCHTACTRAMRFNSTGIIIQ